MPVETAADKLYFTTVRLEARTGTNVIGGTGFIYSVEVEKPDNPDEHGESLFLVTNRHVVDKSKDALLMTLLKANPDNTPDLGQPVLAQLNQADDAWTRHPDPEVDVAVFPFNQVAQLLETRKTRPSSSPPLDARGH